MLNFKPPFDSPLSPSSRGSSVPLCFLAIRVGSSEYLRLLIFLPGRDWGQEEKGTTEDEMAGWHHWPDGRESEWTPGVGDGQGGLVCCDSWGRRVGHDWATELNWTELNLDSSLEFIQPGISRHVLCLQIQQAGWQYTALSYFFPNFELVLRSMSDSNCYFLTCTQFSQETGKVVWCSHLLKNFPQFVVIHTVKGFSVINEADVFLEFSCFFYDPADVGNLISGPSAFSKSSLYVWKFSVHILLKPSLKDFEHYLASMWNEYNCMLV